MPLSVTNSSFNSSRIDDFGNVTLPTSFVETSRVTPGLSPPWGQSAQKTVTFNTAYKVQPLGVLPASGRFLNGNQAGSILLCALTPIRGEQRDLEKHKQIRLNRVKVIRQRKRAAIWKSCLFSNLKQRTLKRLQRQPVLKAKKQEVFEKWEKRKLRREFRRRRQKPVSFCNYFATLSSAWVNESVFRERSESPFQCPVWSCGRTSRRRRRDECSQDKYFTSLRKNQPSRLSCRSDRSRSPITLRSSPFT